MTAIPAFAAAYPSALLQRIRTVTVSSPDLAASEVLYAQWLGHTVAERGTIPAALAQSWGAPKVAGRRFVSFRPASGVDVFIRAIESDPVPGYEPRRTTGWNAIEIIVDDVYALAEKLKPAPYERLGGPRPLGGSGLGSIHAMQIVGPSQEVLYLTCETGDRQKSNLPIPQSFVDRPFIMILAGTDYDAMERFYTGRLGLVPGGRYPTPVTGGDWNGLPVPEDFVFTIGIVRFAQKGNSIELDGYPRSAGRRPQHAGHLPPGIAMSTFTVRDLGALDLPFIGAPASHYGKLRSATFVGPAGELVELVEEPA
jgi:catechol 2,3-dioxygenase-like lactoylglutathione lyase family enzyme